MTLIFKQNYSVEKMRVVKAIQIVLKKYPTESLEGIASRAYGVTEKWRKEQKLVSSIGSPLISPTGISKFVNELRKSGIIKEK